MYKHWLIVSLLEGFSDIRKNVYMWFLLMKEPYHPYKVNVFYYWLNYESISFQYWMDMIKNNKYLGE